MKSEKLHGTKVKNYYYIFIKRAHTNEVFEKLHAYETMILLTMA